MNYIMLRWWVLVCSLAVAAAVLQFKGMFVLLWFADLSGLSFIALSVFVLLTGFIGVLTHRLSKHMPGSPEYKENIRYLQGCWYISELLMALGMMGTLIGFMMMLGPSLAGLASAELVAAKTGIFSMASGMSTSVTATLAGLITSQLSKLQLISLEISLADEE
jgi:hypothetical protein